MTIQGTRFPWPCPVELIISDKSVELTIGPRKMVWDRGEGDEPVSMSAPIEVER
jgi:hypothetical protein